MTHDHNLPCSMGAGGGRFTRPCLFAPAVHSLYVPICTHPGPRIRDKQASTGQSVHPEQVLMAVGTGHLPSSQIPTYSTPGNMENPETIPGPAALQEETGQAAQNYTNGLCTDYPNWTNAPTFLGRPLFPDPRPQLVTKARCWQNRTAGVGRAPGCW